MTSPYVAERLTSIGAASVSRRRRSKINHASVELKREIRRAYLAKCPCCQARPTQRQLADRYGVTQHVVWRAINQPIIDRFKSAHLKRSFKRISAVQVAAMLCEGVDEGRASV